MRCYLSIPLVQEWDVLVKSFLEAFFAENLGVLGGAFCLKNFRWFYPDFYSRIDQFVV